MIKYIVDFTDEEAKVLRFLIGTWEPETDEDRKTKYSLLTKDFFHKDMETDNKEEYIYEKLSPGEVLIISREDDEFLIAINLNGETILKRVKI